MVRFRIIGFGIELGLGQARRLDPRREIGVCVGARDRQGRLDRAAGRRGRRRAGVRDGARRRDRGALGIAVLVIHRRRAVDVDVPGRVDVPFDDVADLGDGVAPQVERVLAAGAVPGVDRVPEHAARRVGHEDVDPPRDLIELAGDLKAGVVGIEVIGADYPHLAEVDDVLLGDPVGPAVEIRQGHAEGDRGLVHDHVVDVDGGGRLRDVQGLGGGLVLGGPLGTPPGDGHERETDAHQDEHDHHHQHERAALFGLILLHGPSSSRRCKWRSA